METLDPLQIAQDPSCASADIRLREGLAVRFRPLQKQDSAILGPYFLGLSEQTRRVYGPHLFDQPTADRLCAEIDPSQLIRMIAVLREDGDEKVIAYFILQLGVGAHELQRYSSVGIALDPALDCLVAPSVADAYQSQGLGSLLMPHVFAVARRLGRRRVVLMGGVYQANERAVHFYKKMGFQAVGTFASSEHPDRPSYDMYLDLECVD